MATQENNEVPTEVKPVAEQPAVKPAEPSSPPAADAAKPAEPPAAQPAGGAPAVTTGCQTEPVKITSTEKEQSLPGEPAKEKVAAEPAAQPTEKTDKPPTDGDSHSDQIEQAEKVDGELRGLPGDYEEKEIKCPTVGELKVFIQGKRCGNEVVILTVHDLGCNHTMYQDFVTDDQMIPIRDRTVWVHVNVPGQAPGSADLSSSYVFPTMQKIGDELVCVLDQLNIKEVVCFGEGAGANILARFAMAHIDRVLGCVLIHATGTTAGFLESLKDKVINWKLENIGMNPTAEAYLVLHRFGSFHRAEDADSLKSAIELYQDTLRNKTNPKNLKLFVNAFLKRTAIVDKVEKLKCPVLLVTGEKSVFNTTTRNLHKAIVKVCRNKSHVEFLEIQRVANVFEENPADRKKLVESFQYFLQGLGLISSVPMRNIRVKPFLRNRSMSMEEWDLPKLRQRSFSGSEEGGSPAKHNQNNSTAPLPSA